MTAYYLMDATVSEDAQGIKLIFYNPSKNKWKELVDTDYNPYFFIPYPISKTDLETIKDLELETSVVEKIDLFTRKAVKLAKVELNDFSNSLSISREFSKTWEEDVPVVSSYMFDKNLVFGAKYRIKGKNVIPLLGVSKELLKEFKQVFSEIKKADPEKYKLSKRLFILCSQPVPDVSLKRFNIQKIGTKQLYKMFMLARIANIPVPLTYTRQKVTRLIKSFFHNYLRRNNFLIPTEKELRQGENTHRVQGALTFSPEPGVYYNTVVVDFDSMYPSLIDSYNLSHETIDCEHSDCETNKVPTLSHHVCNKKRGAYSILIGALKNLRIHWFKPRSQNKSISTEDRHVAETATSILKHILVSSYGVVIKQKGISRSSLGESITAFGRDSLRSARKIAERKGLHVTYGDTDSLFLDDPTEKEIEWLIKTVKKHLKLDFSIQSRYNLCVLTKAAKSYFGIKEGGKTDIKGLTAAKSNSPDFIFNVFDECIQELIDVKNASDLMKVKPKIKRIVQKAIDDLVLGDIPLEDLEYSVVIHEDPKEKLNAKAIHQSYQCAVQLLESGKSVKQGDEMRFVKVKPFNYKGRRFTVKPTEFVKKVNEVNTLDYLRNLKTALNQTFEPMQISINTFKKSKETLFGFL